MRHSEKTIRVLLFIVLLIYLILLIYCLFFASTLGREGLPEGYKGVNLIPFTEISRYINNWHTVGAFYTLMNILGNVAIFIPAGILFPLIFKGLNKPVRIVLTGLILSFAAETLQHIFSIGVFDVDDIILNALGTAVGFCICRAL